MGRPPKGTESVKAQKQKETGVLYRQCRLEKKDGEGVKEQVAFIPAEFAFVGNIVGIKKDGLWEDGWTVMVAGPDTDESYVNGLRRAWKRHRDVSDI